MPIKTMIAQMKIAEVDATTSEISMSMDFVVKGGPFGWLMGALMIRPIMKGAFRKVMTGWAYHSATGEIVEEKLPSDEALSTVLAC